MTFADPQMLRRLDAALEAPAGKHVGVLGLGVAGRAMAQYLARRGARVLGADRREDLDAGDICDGLKGGSIEIVLGDTNAETFAEVDALAISPGADPRQDAIAGAAARAIPIFGELELARSGLTKAADAVVAITGTNGKSTTTGLIGALVESCHKRAFVGGNFGTPIVAWLDRQERVDVAVLELSSFQLETAYRFRPDVAVILNVTPDHGDRYESLESYAAAKQHLVEGLDRTSVGVLSHDDERVRAMASASAGRLWWFSTSGPDLPADGACLDADRLMPRGEVAALGTLDLAHPRLLGRHNRENALAAMLAVWALAEPLGATPAALTRGYHAFAGLEHRLELAAEVGNIRWINDSKATNDESAAVGMRAMDRPVVLLLGGRDKGGGYAQVRAEAEEAARLVIAFGEAREKIAAAFRGHSGLIVCVSFQAALETARQQTQSGESVLLSPACSSFDEFPNYRARGRAFKAFARTVPEGEAP